MAKLTAKPRREAQQSADFQALAEYIIAGGRKPTTDEGWLGDLDLLPRPPVEDHMDFEGTILETVAAKLSQEERDQLAEYLAENGREALVPFTAALAAPYPPQIQAVTVRVHLRSEDLDAFEEWLKDAWADFTRPMYLGPHALNAYELNWTRLSGAEQDFWLDNRPGWE